jgi:hypothetical protein
MERMSADCNKEQVFWLTNQRDEQVQAAEGDVGLSVEGEGLSRGTLVVDPASTVVSGSSRVVEAVQVFVTRVGQGPLTPPVSVTAEYSSSVDFLKLIKVFPE